MSNVNIYDMMKSVESERREERVTLEAQKTEAIAMLAALDVARAEIEYDGSGDQGMTTGCHFFDDWDVNDGSFGTAKIHVAEGTVTFSHQVREMITHDDDFEV